MPPSIFEGRAWPAPGEPLWLEEDRRWALALVVEEGDECPGCHGQLEETTDPANEDRYRAEGIRCFRCYAQQIEMRAFHKDGDPTGLLIMADLKQ